MFRFARISFMAFISLITFSCPIHAAEAVMPVTVKLIRCVTQAERVNMCQEQQMCCNLASPERVTVLSAEGIKSAAAKAGIK